MYVSKHTSWAKRLFLQPFYCKKWTIPICLTKPVLKTTSSTIFNNKKVDFDESQLSRQITSNTTFRLYFLKKIVVADFEDLVGRSNPDTFWENEGKIHEAGHDRIFL